MKRPSHPLRRRAPVRTVIALILVSSTLAARPPKRPRAPAKARPAAAEDAPSPAEAPAKSIVVTVVEVEGAQAYLTPGAKAGVVRGTKVTIHRREFTAVQATDSFATISVGDDPPREQDEGRAVPSDSNEAEKAVELPKPTALSAWEHAWTAAPSPAQSQTPRFVPLGASERDRRWDVRLSASAGALLPLSARGSNLGRVELDAKIHAAPFEFPAALDVDVAVERWFDANLALRAGAEARPLVYARELFASYGTARFYGGVGRMRYAASTLGTLDGARASAAVGAGFSVGAFGGLLPNPLSGAPSTAANRFGVEARYSRPDADLRPDAALVVSGSTFAGKVDERRLSGVFGLYPGHSRLGGYFEASAFDASNPWNAKPVELTAAGIDTSVRSGIFELEGRFDLRQPERSRWLASFLPASWFCTTVPTPGVPAGAEPCDGGTNTRASGAVDAGIELDHLSLVLGATTTGDLSQSSAPRMTGGFATGRVLRIARILRIEVSGDYGTGTYVDVVGGGIGPGVSLFDDAMDLSVYYRGAALTYRSIPTSLVEHAVGGTLIVVSGTDLLMALSSEAIAGGDAKALALFASITWHPDF